VSVRRKEAWICDLGRCEYDRAYRIQLELHAGRAAREVPDTLLLVEHPPVITLGKSGKMGNLLVSDEELARRGIALRRVERGGDVTYHGPGQLVGYPVFLIRESFAGIRPFVRDVESALMTGLADLGIEAHREEGYTGVFVGEEKIAAIGLAVKRWVSFHGFALNVSTDLGAFDLINACGIGRKATSVERVLGREVGFDRVKDSVRRGFEEVFSIEFRRVAPGEVSSTAREGSAG